MINNKTIKAAHLAIGSELTSGQTINTNSHYIAKFLQKNGVINTSHIVIPDNKELIKDSLDFMNKEVDWIFVYGGLGPTSDDFTRNILAEWAGVNLILDPNTWQFIQDYLKNRNYPVREFQQQQAYFPTGSTIMTNSKGTAHGFLFPWKDKTFFVLPGPPKEILSICENFLFNYIEEKTVNTNSWLTYIWNTFGKGESEVAYLIEPLIHDHKIEVGYRVHLPYVEVKISFFKHELKQHQKLIEQVDETLSNILVYKELNPLPEFFRNQLAKASEFLLLDSYSQGRIYKDLSEWTHGFQGLSFKYQNHSKNTSAAESYIKLDSAKSDKIKAEVKLNNKVIHLDLNLTPVIKLPPERQIFFV
ncbi:MAG: hypothetical protein KDD45_18185, partial [Bdellovibrionales bacterium]|nr:hypothetical protein [Bdellovibrionales bacterium]